MEKLREAGLIGGMEWAGAQRWPKKKKITGI